MVVSINDLSRLFIHATDGDLGKAIDFFFNDRLWTIRYIVVDASSWMAEPKVLISPIAVPVVAPGLKRLMTPLNREQVRESPGWVSDKPISRQYEVLFSDYYKYPYYWDGPALWGYAQYPISMAVWAALQTPDADKRSELKSGIVASQLRSARTFSKFVLDGVDGEIGTLDDFIIDEQSWEIRFLVVEIGRWLPGRKILISPRWIENIDWIQSKVKLKVSRETIWNAPGYENLSAITRDYEVRLFTCYGKPYLNEC